ncbi:hypothetical protein BDC45DRAFT_607202 [Circinella umbellata]|nr:hypothetical protein BDC45DRAFT_607202 [Circinella umbellata]
MSNQNIGNSTGKKKYLQTKLSFVPVNSNNNNENNRPTSSSSSSSSTTLNINKLKTINNTFTESVTDNNVKEKLKHKERNRTPSTENKLSFTKLPQQEPTPLTIEPPTLNPIALLYNQQDLWVRLQIREFVFRFGSYFDIDSRATASLQNVQGNWRIKRLGVNLTYQLLLSMEHGFIDIPSSSFHSTTNKQSLFYGARTMQQLANKLIYDWMDNYDLNNSHRWTKEAARIEFIERLQRDGLNVHHWENLIELLSIVTGIASSTTTDNEEEEEDIIMEDVNNRMPEPEEIIHSLPTELKMLQMICDLLLLHNSLRRIWVHEEQSKEFKLQETELKFERKQLLQEQQLQKEDTKQSERQIQVEKKLIDTMIAQQKNTKRFSPAGQDMKGNEYWIFNDLITYGNDARNSEPYWGHGVIIIGPGFISDDVDMDISQQEQEQETKNKWWYISDVNDITQLRRYIIQQNRPSSTASTTNNNNNDIEHLLQQLNIRSQYLQSLEFINQLQSNHHTSITNNRRTTRA